MRVPQSGPAAAIPLTLDPGMWLNLVTVKPPYLANLEIESTKKFILDYERYSQKCQFIFEEYLDIIVSESGGELEEIIE